MKEEDRLTTDLVFRDPYLLDFLGLGRNSCLRCMTAKPVKTRTDWTTIATPPARKQTTYVVKVVLDGTTRRIPAANSGPTDQWIMIVKSKVEDYVDSNKLVITRPVGKQYKPTIIRREWDLSAPSVK